jgi:hypothetical protein
LSSTRLCTDQFIRLHVLDKISASSRGELAITRDKSKVKYAFFTGSRSFVVEREGIKLKFRFTGVGWLINDLDLGLGEAKH